MAWPGSSGSSGEEVAEYEPHCRAVSALLVPETGIVDYGQVAERMAGLIRDRGAEIMTGAGVSAIRRDGDGLVARDGRGARCSARYLDQLRRAALRPRGGADGHPPRGPDHPLPRRVLHADGRERRSLVRNLIYPVPDPEFPFLGVHFTRTVHGDVEAGPNAVLAFAREGYRLGTVRPGELARHARLSRGSGTWRGATGGWAATSSTARRARRPSCARCRS